MRNTLFGLLSVVVLAAALTVGPVSVTPVAEAQFASNNRSVKVRNTAAGNVATPASGYAAIFRDDTYQALMVKDSAGLVYGVNGKVPVTTLTASTVLTDAHLGEIIVYDGDASGELTLPIITTSNIGMRIRIIALDADDLIVESGTALDVFVDASDGTIDSTGTTTPMIVATTVGASADLIAISATQWLVVPVGTWTIA